MYCHPIYTILKYLITLAICIATQGCKSGDSHSDQAVTNSDILVHSTINPSSPLRDPSEISSWIDIIEGSHTSCPGKRLGTYTWDMSYFRDGNRDLITLLDSDVGRQYACGDLYINVADYSSPEVIPNEDGLVDFIKEFRERVGNPAAVVYLTYGDVTARNGSAMISFTRTFFDWAMKISAADAALMGRIGISYDVEHVDPEDSKTALLLSRDLRARTEFGTNIYIQHTIDGDRNILSTEYVMRYADSALAMLYSNEPRGLVELINWLLAEQCERCLDDEYSTANYGAKISVIVEASCKMGRGCSEKSMCVKDGPNEGMMYISDCLNEAIKILENSGILTLEQFTRLFNTQTLWVVHNFEWQRCYAPFSNHFDYPSCKDYHVYAKSCRGL
jgi:hypothetical protein